MIRSLLSCFWMIAAMSHATAQTGGLMVRQLARPPAASSAVSAPSVQKERSTPVAQQPAASGADAVAIQQVACFKQLTERHYEQLRSASRKTGKSSLTCAR